MATVALLAAGQPASAAYNVSVSTLSTLNMNCTPAPVVCSATGTPARLNSGFVNSTLAAGNLTINNGAGGAETGTLSLIDGVTWTSTYSLTLAGTNNVLINAPVIAGSGGLNLSGSSVTGGGGQQVAVSSLVVDTPGAVSLGGLLNFTPNVTINAPTGDVVWGNNRATNFGNTTAKSLSVSSRGVGQLAGTKIEVSGNTSFTTGDADTTLTGTTGNSFGGVVSLSGRSASITTAGTALSIGSTSLLNDATFDTTNNGAVAGAQISQSLAQQIYARNLTARAGSGNDVDLFHPNSLTGDVTIISAKNASVRTVTDLSLGASTIANTLTLFTSRGVSQTGAVSAQSLALDAGRDFDLHMSNTFPSVRATGKDGTLNTGGSLAIQDGTNIERGGQFTAGGAITVGASSFGDLTLYGGGNITQSAGDILTTGSAIFGAGNGNVTLANAGDSIGRVGGSGAAVTVASKDDLEVAGLFSTGATSLRSGGDLTFQKASFTSVPAMLAIADRSLSVGADATVSSSGAMTLVADNAAPAAPYLGFGSLIVNDNATINSGGGSGVALYSAERDQNLLHPAAKLNGASFTPGTIYADSDRERWNTYYPGGTSTSPFTVFYKDFGTAPSDGGGQPPVQPAPPSTSGARDVNVNVSINLSQRLVGDKPSVTVKVGDVPVGESIALFLADPKDAPSILGKQPTAAGAGKKLIATSKLTVSKPGTYKLPLKLNKAAKQRLKRAKKLKVPVSVIAGRTCCGGWKTSSGKLTVRAKRARH